MNDFNPDWNVYSCFHYTHHNIYNYGQHLVLLNVFAMTCNGWIWHSSSRFGIQGGRISSSRFYHSISPILIFAIQFQVLDFGIQVVGFGIQVVDLDSRRWNPNQYLTFTMNQEFSSNLNINQATCNDTPWEHELTYHCPFQFISVSLLKASHLMNRIQHHN